MMVRVVMVPVTYRSDDPTDSWGGLGIARDLAQKLAERMAMKHQKELHIANSRAARAKLKGAATKFTQMLELSPILELFLMRERRSVVISNSDPENSACQRANHRLDVSFNRLSGSHTHHIEEWRDETGPPGTRTQREERRKELRASKWRQRWELSGTPR